LQSKGVLARLELLELMELVRFDPNRGTFTLFGSREDGKVVLLLSFALEGVVLVKSSDQLFTGGGRGFKGFFD
jgi:hypothetical protein